MITVCSLFVLPDFPFVDNDELLDTSLEEELVYDELLDEDVSEYDSSLEEELYE